MSEMKTTPTITFERVLRQLRGRYNPIPSLTPDALARQLEEFRQGRFSRIAQSMEVVEERDDRIASVAPKRKKAPGRNGFEILMTDEKHPQAMIQKEKLEWFYNHLTATNAIDQNKRGGFSTLARQMLDSLGKKYSVHEIIWKPNQPGGNLAAEFLFVPLWFFDNTEGRLKFIQQEGSSEGLELDLDNGEWLVTVNDKALMVPCMVAWMFKRLPLQDWLGFCEKFGIPYVTMKTDAERNTPEWDEVVKAVNGIMSESSLVYKGNEEIDIVELAKSGKLAFPDLIDRMDRAITTLWRGGDLGTMSRGGDAVGASVQESETDILEEDDAELLTETLNTQVDRKVIDFLFGEGAEQVAYIQVKTGQKIDDARELKKWETGAKLGVALSAEKFRETFELPTPEKTDELLKMPGGSQEPDPDKKEEGKEEVEANAAANAIDPRPDPAFRAAAVQGLGKAQARDMQGFFEEVTRILSIKDDADFISALAKLQGDFPTFLKLSLTDSATASAFERQAATAFIEGAVDGRGELLEDLRRRTASQP